jgi:hypothetical protein
VRSRTRTWRRHPADNPALKPGQAAQLRVETACTSSSHVRSRRLRRPTGRTTAAITNHQLARAMTMLPLSTEARVTLQPQLIINIKISQLFLPKRTVATTDHSATPTVLSRSLFQRDPLLDIRQRQSERTEQAPPTFAVFSRHCRQRHG